MSPPPRWLRATRRYVIVVCLGNLIWEVAQLPLYTLWRNESLVSLVRATLHCTIGDIVIATVVLVGALAIVGDEHWPDRRFSAVATAAIAFGIMYTIGSEYVATVVRKSWAYTEWMPTLPWLGTGLTPLAQWLVIPCLAFGLSRPPSDTL